MDIQTLESFFMWCTIINGAILLEWVLFFIFAPDFVYRMQSRLFPIPREKYNLIIYSLLGAFKLFLIFFNIVPYLALVIIN